MPLLFLALECVLDALDSEPKLSLSLSLSLVPLPCLAWLIYNPNTRSITRTDSDVFNEQLKPHGLGQSNKCTSNETEIKCKTPQNFALSGGVNNSKPSTNNVLSAESGITTPRTFYSDIHRITQITDSIERQDYVLNLFDKMDDADIDPKDYYGMTTNADAHADSLLRLLILPNHKLIFHR
jgi:hypothetical protein